VHGIWKNHALEELRQDVNAALKTQTMQSPLFARGILERVIDPNAVSLEEAIELIAGLDAEETLQFRLRDSVFAISLGRNHLQSFTREIASTGC
jgi:hypothetical protein